MEVLDTSIANVALPHIAGDLGASTGQGTWVLTRYLGSNAITLPVGAWASSIIGRKKFFLLCNCSEAQSEAMVGRKSEGSFDGTKADGNRDRCETGFLGQRVFLNFNGRYRNGGAGFGQDNLSSLREQR
jgi:hypothetical protein